VKGEDGAANGEAAPLSDFAAVAAPKANGDMGVADATSGFGAPWPKEKGAGAPEAALSGLGARKANGPDAVAPAPKGLAGLDSAPNVKEGAADDEPNGGAG